MGWIFFRESVASQPPYDPGSELSPIVSVSPTHRPSYCPECGRVTLTRLPFGTMCRHCPQTTSHVWTSSVADSPARISALQALELAWRESEVDLYLNFSGSLASADLDSSSWKTSQLSLFGGLTAFSWNSMRWGLMRDGQLFQPQKWEPRTYGNGSGFLPTPTAVDYGSNNHGIKEGKAQSKGSLQQMARQGVWLGSPTARMSERSEEFALGRLPTPAEFAKRWPTPRASDGDKGGPNQSQDGSPSLVSRAVGWPTPQARDAKDGLTPKRHGRHSPSVAVAVAESGHPGYLNPQFVEVLMGYPIGWTVCADWATPLFRKQRGKLSAGSPASTMGKG